MKVTLGFKNSPWSKIHLPLPRTPRQSQQLLNALTSSFRRQLDREYPPTAPTAEQREHRTPDNDGGSHSTHNPHSSAHATDKHLRTILENPLFSVAPLNPTARTLNRNSFEQRLAEEPMAIFDQMVASGSVTSYILRRCLKSQLLLARLHNGEDFVKALAESKTGTKVVAWWFASDSETRKTLFREGVLTSLLKFMVAERLYDPVFDWLRFLERYDLGGLDGRISKTEAELGFYATLNSLVRAECQYGGGISSAIRLYVRACKMHISFCNELPKLQYRLKLLHVGNHLRMWIAQNEYGGAKEIPPTVYEDLVGVIGTIAPRSILTASLPLYHPTKPDAKPFVDYFRRIPSGRFEQWEDQKQDHLMRTGFEALRVLIDNERIQDFSDLARLMQQKLRGKTDSGYHASRAEDLLIRMDLTMA